MSSLPAIHRGDLFWLADDDTRGLAHPHVVVQDDVFNRSRITTVIVCALTSNLNKASEPGNVLLDPDEGNLPAHSVRAEARARDPRHRGARGVTTPTPAPRATLRELALLFGKLGFTAFGGPAAHVAMMEAEVVRRRGWMTRERFLDLVGATNLIPGPNSTELAIHVGHDQAGWSGLVVAGACFILPAVLIVSAIAWVYVRYGALPAFTGVMYGIKPVIIAVVLQALWGLTKTAVKTWFLGVVGGLAVAATLAGVNELAVLVAAGAIVGLGRRARGLSAASFLPLPLLGGGAASATGTVATFGLWPLFLFFLKVGSVLFGSGYVLLAFLRSDLVDHFHWLTESQLLDAVAVGQVTPGPVFTTATFIGYVLGGAPGAALSTLGIFLPAFVFVAVSGPLIPRIRRSPTAGAVLDGVNVASLALMAAVTLHLGCAAIIDLPTALLAAASAVVLIRFRPNSAWLVLAGGVIGAAVYAF